MFFIVSITIGLIVLFLSTTFLGAVFYHLFQYQLPNNNHKKAVATIAIVSIIFIFAGYWIFSNIPWDTL